MTLAPFCHGNDQTPRLYFKVWLVVPSPWWCGPEQRTVPPSILTCLACFPLEISMCVWNRIGACNPKSYRQNQVPLFCLSEVICTNGKWRLLCLIHCACKNYMWAFCSDGTGVESTWEGNWRQWEQIYLRTVMKQIALALVLFPGKRKSKSKHLRLQLLCLKGLVINFLWKMLSDSRKKSKLMVSKLWASILWTARKLSF